MIYIIVYELQLFFSLKSSELKSSHKINFTELIKYFSTDSRELAILIRNKKLKSSSLQLKSYYRL